MDEFEEEIREMEERTDNEAYCPLCEEATPECTCWLALEWALKKYREFKKKKVKK